MPKFTPGPWCVDNSRHEGSVNRMDPFRHIGMVSNFLHDNTSRDENEANAKLIAAAPDLLHALSALIKAAIVHGVEETQFGQIALSDAQHALSKAID